MCTVAEAVSVDSDADSGTMTTENSSDVTSACKTPTATSDDVIRRSPGNSFAGVECHLELRELWDKFHKLGTEMIITKSGRCAGIHEPNIACN